MIRMPCKVGRRVNDRDPLTGLVIGCAIEVHRVLGPGLLENAYEACLAHELARHALPVKRQVPLPVVYKDVQIDCGYRIDLLIPDQLIIEVKAVEGHHPIHRAQLLTYMRLSRIPTGLLLNFNVRALKDGILRMVL
jgi:GxxExxY protein